MYTHIHICVYICVWACDFLCASLRACRSSKGCACVCVHLGVMSWALEDSDDELDWEAAVKFMVRYLNAHPEVANALRYMNKDGMKQWLASQNWFGIEAC